MKRVVGGLILVFGILISIVVPNATVLASASSILITEIQAGSATSASEEYVQISNISSSQVDVTGWKLEYFSASSKDFTSPTRSIGLSGNIKAGEDYIVASTGYKSDIVRSTFSSTISAAGGHLRLVSGGSSPSQTDLVGWGNALHALTSPAPALPAGQILSRKLSNNIYANIGNNSVDFELINPSSLSAVSGSAELIITEVLPNPAKPATDADGEFIEIYNPNAIDVNLAGYKILTGASLNHNYTFKNQTVAANSYIAFYSSETKATLANSGGKVQLQDAAGKVLNETASYSNAAEGNSWAWDGQNWVWTNTVTPNSENIISQPENNTESKVSKAATKSSKSSAKAKTTKPKATNASSKSKGNSGVLGDSTTIPAKAMHPAVLAGVGSLALLYGAYEYRQDFFNLIRKLRSHRKAR